MIKKFAFRLERVLRHRASVVEMKERALAEVEAQLVIERRILGDLLRLRGELLGDMARLQAGRSFSGLERDLYQQYLEWLAMEQERERRVIGELEVLCEAKRAELIAASQEHRVVERLKERRREEHRGEVAHLEQNELDEVAANAFVRQGSRADGGDRVSGESQP